MPKPASSVGGSASDRKSSGFRSCRHAGTPARPVGNASPPTFGMTRTGVARSAPPLPKRNKGRFFVGSIFLSLALSVAYITWTCCLRYHCYGVIQGRLITVSSPSQGVVSHWQVNEGDEVRQGQPLVEIFNLELRHSLENLLDELKVNQAQLDAETAKIQLQRYGFQTSSEKALAEYLQASGELESEQARLDDLDKQLDRAQKLVKTRNFSQQKYEQLHFEYTGQQKKLIKLSQAVFALKARHEMAQREQVADRDLQLQPMLTRIDTIQSEIKRLREKIQQGRLLAPVNGRVTRRHYLTGESLPPNEPLVEILEHGSTEAVLYVPQESLQQFEIGRQVSIELPPLKQNVVCEVVRLSEHLEPPPKHIQRFYAHDIVLLQVYLRPHPEFEQEMSMRINGTVKLPMSWIAVYHNEEESWISTPLQWISDRFGATWHQQSTVSLPEISSPANSVASNPN